jgi:acyl-CoA thioesterase YciA
MKESTLRITLLPRDTNKHGSIFGGIILSHIDLAGSIEARITSGPHNFATVAMDKVVFHKPVFVGDVEMWLVFIPARSGSGALLSLSKS